MLTTLPHSYSLGSLTLHHLEESHLSWSPPSWPVLLTQHLVLTHNHHLRTLSPSLLSLPSQSLSLAHSPSLSLDVSNFPRQLLRLSLTNISQLTNFNTKTLQQFESLQRLEIKNVNSNQPEVSLDLTSSVHLHSLSISESNLGGVFTFRPVSCPRSVSVSLPSNPSLESVNLTTLFSSPPSCSFSLDLSTNTALTADFLTSQLSVLRANFRRLDRLQLRDSPVHCNCDLLTLYRRKLYSRMFNVYCKNWNKSLRGMRRCPRDY